MPGEDVAAVRAALQKTLGSIEKLESPSHILTYLINMALCELDDIEDNRLSASSRERAVSVMPQKKMAPPG